MIVRTNREYGLVDIYPFVDNKEDMPFSARITVRCDGMICYQGNKWSTDDIESLKTSFDGAIAIAANFEQAMDKFEQREENQDV